MSSSPESESETVHLGSLLEAAEGKRILCSDSKVTSWTAMLNIKKKRMFVRMSMSGTRFS